jgi:hypothetical protein
MRSRLAALEEEVVGMLGAKKGNAHKYGANVGVNLGLSVVAGGGVRKSRSVALQRTNQICADASTRHLHRYLDQLTIRNPGTEGCYT